MSDKDDDNQNPPKAPPPQEPPAAPPLRLIRPQARPPTGKGARRGPDIQITKEKYDRACEAYLLGNRTIGGLAALIGCTRTTAKRMIQIGYPRLKWASLAARAEVYDRERDREMAKKGAATTPMQMDEMSRWIAMRQQNQQMHIYIRGLASKAAALSLNALEKSTANRHIVVQKVVELPHPTKAGKTVKRVINEVQELPPYFPVVVQAMRQLTALTTQSGAAEALWAKITVPDHLKGASTGWDKLTPEETDYIIQNAGKLPPGITIDMLRQRQ